MENHSGSGCSLNCPFPCDHIPVKESPLADVDKLMGDMNNPDVPSIEI